MLIHDLSAEECGRVLTAADLGHLACANHGEPYVVPIHLAFDAERRCVYGVSAIASGCAPIRSTETQGLCEVGAGPPSTGRTNLAGRPHSGPAGLLPPLTRLSVQRACVVHSVSGVPEDYHESNND
jgi:hypothetical protein